MKGSFKSFTLAEVLITVMVLGIIAVNVIPDLIHNYKSSVLKSQFDKSYSVISNAVKMCNLNEDFEYSNMENTNFIDEYTKKLLLCLKVEKEVTCNDKNESIVNFSKYKNKNGTENGHWSWGWHKYLILSDGMWIFPEQSSIYGKFIFIDINGYTKGPNRQGYDLFAFQIAEDGALMPDNAFGNECILTNLFSGFDCTKQALTDPNYFKNLPK